MIKRVIGWIETILGFFVTVGSIFGITVARSVTKVEIPDSITIPLQGGDVAVNGISEALKGLLDLIPILVIAYSIIILLLGILIFLEGLSKIGFEKVEIKKGKLRK